MVKRNGKNREHLTVLNVPHLRKKIKKTCANRPVSCVNGENPSDFGSPKEPAYRCATALGRRACPLSLAPLASSPIGRAIGMSGNSALTAGSSIWHKIECPATEIHNSLTKCSCPEAAALCSRALLFPKKSDFARPA